MPNFNILTHINKFDCNQGISSVEFMNGLNQAVSNNHSLKANPNLNGFNYY